MTGLIRREIDLCVGAHATSLDERRPDHEFTLGLGRWVDQSLGNALKTGV
jgi:hypothetical protein